MKKTWPNDVRDAYVSGYLNGYHRSKLDMILLLSDDVKPCGAELMKGLSEYVEKLRKDEDGHDREDVQ